MKIVIKFFKPFIEIFPEVASRYRYIRDSRSLNLMPQKTALGFKFIGNKVMESGNFEVIETRFIRKFLENVDVVVNVGANIGYYTCIALSLKKYVIAVEPIALNIQYLLKNITANFWDSMVEVYQVAASNRTGAVAIYGGGTGASLLKGWSGSFIRKSELVPCNTLDNLLGDRFEEKICFFLIDVEGSELYALEGAKEIIKRELKPIWFIEITSFFHQGKNTVLNKNLLPTFDIFWKEGYVSWMVDSQPRLIEKEEIMEIIATGNNTLQAYNFIFFDANAYPDIPNTLVDPR